MLGVGEVTPPEAPWTDLGGIHTTEREGKHRVLLCRGGKDRNEFQRFDKGSEDPETQCPFEDCGVSNAHLVYYSRWLTYYFQPVTEFTGILFFGGGGGGSEYQGKHPLL